jgi:U2 small nuclear ribonucleoprotein A'
MKLSLELISSAPSFINPLKDRELLLRGHNITLIENLGVTRDTNDVIDFTDNDIRVLGNFPRMTRLKGLLCARNRISHIQQDLPKVLPNINTLILTNNSLTELSEIDCISEWKDLLYLSLVDNPLTTKDYYRLYVIWRNPGIRVLDFEKVKDQERKTAIKLFGTVAEPSELASQIMGTKSKTFDSFQEAGVGSKLPATKLSDGERKNLQEQLKNAKTLAEVDRIERALRSGHILN